VPRGDAQALSAAALAAPSEPIKRVIDFPMEKMSDVGQFEIWRQTQ
jgi:hypothetical protein